MKLSTCAFSKHSTALNEMMWPATGSVKSLERKCTCSWYQMFELYTVGNTNCLLQNVVSFQWTTRQFDWSVVCTQGLKINWAIHSGPILAVPNIQLNILSVFGWSLWWLRNITGRNSCKTVVCPSLLSYQILCVIHVVASTAIIRCRMTLVILHLD